MRTNKFKPFTDPNHMFFNPIIHAWWFLLYNHWLCILGNWHEPLPFPMKRAVEAEIFRDKTGIPVGVYWTIRNFLHNFTHFWIGITPVGDRYVWITPDENGWMRKYVPAGDAMKAYWVKSFYGGRVIIRLWYIDKYIFTDRFGVWNFKSGWSKRGNFTLSFKRNSRAPAAVFHDSMA